MLINSLLKVQIGQLHDAAYNEESVKGLVINPWNRTLKLDKKPDSDYKGREGLRSRQTAKILKRMGYMVRSIGGNSSYKGIVEK